MQESWVFGANDPALGLGLNHLPYTAFLDEVSGQRHLAVAIGACVLDLHAAADLLPEHLRDALREPYLNTFMAMGEKNWSDLRISLQALLSTKKRTYLPEKVPLLPASALEFLLPARTANYTDFYASRHHALRVGELFRPEKPLLDNYNWVPIGYHGRASSLVPSGTPIIRPNGQTRPNPALPPIFGPCQRLDFELELACFIGPGNPLGTPIPLAEAEQHLFGVSLLNDWSARDIQSWEYQPLGPFLGKNFATSVSPFITPMAALKPFRCPGESLTGSQLQYLQAKQNELLGAISMNLSIEFVRGQRQPIRLSKSNSDSLLWTPAHMLTHHTSSGCNLLSGDILATGTISGPDRSQAGCLLELTHGGQQPLPLNNLESIGWLEDGDEIILSGYAEADGELPIRLGVCRGQVMPAITYPLPPEEAQ